MQRINGIRASENSSHHNALSYELSLDDILRRIPMIRDDEDESSANPGSKYMPTLSSIRTIMNMTSKRHQDEKTAAASSSSVKKPTNKISKSKTYKLVATRNSIAIPSKSKPANAKPAIRPLKMNNCIPSTSTGFYGHGPLRRFTPATIATINLPVHRRELNLQFPRQATHSYIPNQFSSSSSSLASSNASSTFSFGSRRKPLPGPQGDMQKFRPIAQVSGSKALSPNMMAKVLDVVRLEILMEQKLREELEKEERHQNERRLGTFVGPVSGEHEQPIKKKAKKVKKNGSNKAQSKVNPSGQKKQKTSIK